MTVSDEGTDEEKANIAVRDSPISDRWVRIYDYMLEGGLPQTYEEALKWVRESKDQRSGYAYIGKVHLHRSEKATIREVYINLCKHCSLIFCNHR